MFFWILLMIAALLVCRVFSPVLMKSAFLLIFLSFLFHSLFSLEYAIGYLNYFNSDELGYTLDKQMHFYYEEYRFRALWHLLNDMVFWLDGGYSFANKLLGLPFLILIHVSIFYLLDKRKYSQLFIFFSPYLIYLSTMDLRDLAIFFLCFQSIYFIVKRYYVWLIIILAPLVFLRPFVLVFILMLVLFDFVIESRMSILKKLMSILFFAMVASVFLYVFSSVFDSYSLRVMTLINNDSSESLRGESIDMSILGVSTYVLKWVFTPIPTSLLIRLVEHGGHEVFGFTDDLIRFINQSVYYCFGFYLLVNLRVFFNGIVYGFNHLSVDGNKFLKLFLVFSLAWSFVYILFSLGEGHTRVKIIFTGFIVLSSLVVFFEKKYRRLS